MAETWPYVAGLGAVTSSGHLILFLFLLLRRKKVREGKLALLYLGLGLLWAAVVALTDLQAIFPTGVEPVGLLILAFATGLAVTQLLLACVFLEFRLLPVVATAGGLWTGILLLTIFQILSESPPPHPLQQVAQSGWVVLAATLVGLLTVAVLRSRLALHRNRALYWLLTSVPLIGGQALSLLPVGPLRGLGPLLHLLGAIALTRGAMSYWLPNVKATLRAILRFLLLFIVTTALPVGVVLGAGQLADRLPLPYIPLVVALAAIAALIYLPLYRWLQQLVNRLLKGVGFEPAQVLRDYSQTIGTILNLDQLASRVVRTVAEVLSVRRGALLVVIETEGEGLELHPVPGLGTIPQEPLNFDPSSPILARILKRDAPLFQYEVEHHPGLQGAAQRERNWLRVLGMEIYLPIRSQGDLTGLLALGPQGIGEPYGSYEIEFLSTLAHQTGVALQNARLFEGLLDLNARITQLNEDFRAANERLGVLDQAKSDFLTIASHELRTPLAQMRGYVEVLIEWAETETLSPDQVLSLAESISRPTRRLENIVGAMLDASEIDAEGLTLHFAPITLASTMRLAIEPCLPALEERNISLTVQGVECLSPIHGDMDRLQQAFRNLISNGIKFTPDGGQITIKAQKLDSEHFHVTITDTGIGISQADQELIFEKFYRVGSVALHSSGQFKFKGAGPGLGLPIARGVIEGHGGCIWVESPGYDEEQCPGSTFHIVLPYEAHREPCRWKRYEKE